MPSSALSAGESGQGSQSDTNPDGEPALVICVNGCLGVGRCPRTCARFCGSPRGGHRHHPTDYPGAPRLGGPLGALEPSPQGGRNGAGLSTWVWSDVNVRGRAFQAEEQRVCGGSGVAVGLGRAGCDSYCGLRSEAAKAKSDGPPGRLRSSDSVPGLAEPFCGQNCPAFELLHRPSTQAVGTVFQPPSQPLAGPQTLGARGRGIITICQETEAQREEAAAFLALTAS